METRSFSVLVALCLAVLFGARFGLERLIGEVAAIVKPDVASEPMMALPPKPTGSEELPEQLGDGPGSGMGLLTREGCEARAESLRDICFHALARQGAARDPQGSLAICAEIQDEELRLECRSDVSEAVAPVDRAAAEQICLGIDSVKWRGQCHFGIGLAMAEIDSSYALGRCEHAEVFRDFCRHDVVGEVALVDLEAAVAFCSQEQGDPLTRKTCWHGIGKYLARRDASEASLACMRSTPQWLGNCYHGLGWGAAERDPDATLAFCQRQGQFRDNCQQGVAHQLKRADPQRAVSLCEGIQDGAIRARCLNFVTR